MFSTVLVANRGEIAVRIMRTLRGMGIRSIAVYSDADAGGRFVREADEAVRIGPPPAAESYLDVKAIIEAAVATGAQAIHPGYGFLSENVAFAQACSAAGIVFIGPPVEAMAAMADKISAKTTVEAAGVPVVPGKHEPGMDDAAIVAAVTEVGFPALLKPSAGGGGKGMRVVRTAEEALDAVASARREALSSFGDDTLLVERYIDRPRHIEVQVMADAHGNVVHLLERECSLQRRHQKVIEEAPSPLLDPQQRLRMGQAAVEVARACGYVGAGTVEFIVAGADPDEFFFLEMNTRLQVEHPVTEEITGIDLVNWQLHVAAGDELGMEQSEITWSGHAIEARIYAEDPAQGFLPSAGRLVVVDEPVEVTRRGGRLTRVDSAVATGDTVGTDYDPMIAKFIAHGPTRAEALNRLKRMLRESAYLGLTTNAGYLQRLLSLPAVVTGDLHTGLIEEHPELLESVPVDTHVLVAAAMERLVALQPVDEERDPWHTLDGWRIGDPAWSGLRVRTPGGAVHDVEMRGLPDAAEVRVDDGEALRATASPRDGGLQIDVAGDIGRYSVAREGDVVWLARDGLTWRLTELDRLDAESAGGPGSAVGSVRSPMPGSVIAVAATVGDQVSAGDPLVTVEAMKMEHTLRAEADSVVAEVRVSAGAQVAMDEVLVVLQAQESATDE